MRHRAIDQRKSAVELFLESGRAVYDEGHAKRLQRMLMDANSGWKGATLD
jgi:hypothetical protein